MESSRKRKLAPEFNRSDLEREMRRQKLKILEDHADFGFLVGAEKGSAVVILIQNLNEQLIRYIL